MCSDNSVEFTCVLINPRLLPCTARRGDEPAASQGAGEPRLLPRAGGCSGQKAAGGAGGLPGQRSAEAEQ